MKHIVKQGEPQAFTDWKALSNEDWQPTYDDLAGDPKRAVKKALMDEQGYICCYCERRLTYDESHIEHFIPQSAQDVDPLDYANFLCSCQSQIRKGEPCHCGNLKDDWFDQDLLVSPLTPECESRFSFTGDGGIQPATENDAAAVESIEKLGLGIPKLNDLRSKAIEPFLDESLSEQDLRDFVSGYLDRDASGYFGEFWMTIRYLFGGIVAV